MTAIEYLRAECGGNLDRLDKAGRVALLLAYDEATGVLKERIAYHLDGKKKGS